MEDKEKSGLQISLGDLVSFFPLCCAFGVPVLFFSVFVGSSVHTSLIANFLPIWTPYATYHALHHIYGIRRTQNEWEQCACQYTNALD
jgi:hypothetical protein